MTDPIDVKVGFVFDGLHYHRVPTPGSMQGESDAITTDGIKVVFLRYMYRKKEPFEAMDRNGGVHDVEGEKLVLTVRGFLFACRVGLRSNEETKWIPSCLINVCTPDVKAQLALPPLPDSYRVELYSYVHAGEKRRRIVVFGEDGNFQEVDLLSSGFEFTPEDGILREKHFKDYAHHSFMGAHCGYGGAKEYANNVMCMKELLEFITICRGFSERKILKQLPLYEEDQWKVRVYW